MVRERRLPSGAAPCECATEETPWGVSDVWQMQDLERCVFGSVAIVGVTREFSDVWQGKDLGDEERQEYPLPPMFL